MTFYVQYDDQGNISATVKTDGLPDCQNQISFPDWIDTDGKMVDVTQNPPALVDMPASG